MFLKRRINFKNTRITCSEKRITFEAVEISFHAMAKPVDYIPKRDDERAIFLHSFNAALPAAAAILGLSAQEVADMVADNNRVVAAIQQMDDAKKTLKSVAAAKRAVLTEVEKKLRRKVARLKAKDTYTEAVGRSLGVVGRGPEWDAQTAQPVLKVLLTAGEVRLRFRKAQSNGIHIWSRRGGEEAFSFLAQCSRSPFRDRRPNLVEGVPERREYYAFYILADDTLVGQQSAVVEAVV